MFALFLPFATALIMLGLGVYLMTASLDTLWMRQEKTLLTKGIQAGRTSIWEEKIRGLGRYYAAIGVILLVFAGYVVVSSAPSNMSGVLIDGRELTKAEWDACGHDSMKCLLIEKNTRRR